MITAGTDTGSTTMEWFIALMINYPDIQVKVQEEIDSVVGKYRLADLDDISRLPYLDSVLKESMRFKSVAPVALPHRTHSESTLGDYFIPAGTQVFYHTKAVCRDPTLWDHPENFDPNHFFKKDISALGSNPIFTPFGIGKRTCPGNVFAMHELFLWSARLFQCFSFSSPTGPVSLEEIWGLTIQPNPFDCKVSLRVSPHLLMPLPPTPIFTSKDSDED